MKKLLFFFVLLLLPVTASTETVEINGIYYELMSENDIKNAEVTKSPNHYSGDVVIPASVTYAGVEYYVTSIGENAFAYCSELTSITIPSNVMSIGIGAFTWCSNLTSITIPNNVTSIGPFAFSSCSGLTSITIPYSVTSIGDGAFNYCSGLTSLIVEDGNSNYDSRNNCNAIIETASNTLIFGCMNTTIPNSVTSIGYAAFDGCTRLTSITIPSSVTNIGRAFDGCSGLTSMIVEDGNPNYDSRNNCNAIIETASNTLIFGCMNTTIPNSVTGIGYAAFDGCTSLISITIPNSVTYIDDYAFYGCSSLTSITIPSSVTYIGDAAFSGCFSLTSITIPNSITRISDHTFSMCTNLTSITIPSSVTSIGRSAFFCCYGLTSIDIPNYVTSIGEGAFTACVNLSSVTIPNSVTNIGNNAFEGSANLTSVIVKMENPCVIYSGCFHDYVYNNSTLYVPNGTIDKYRSTNYWSRFAHIEEGVPSGMDTINLSDSKTSHEVECYDVKGNRLYTPQKGLYIIRMSDGTTKKVIKR